MSVIKGPQNTLTISAKVSAIDGVGQILGQAGPTEGIQIGTKVFPTAGVMEFDAADVEKLFNEGSLNGVILHEMGHVIGVGTLWNDYLSGDIQNPVYTGKNALREYRTLTGRRNASVPVENTGGEGTALGHWRETTFNTELMTGYAEPAGVPMPMSRMTVGCLQDLGYTVDITKADPYTLPSSSQSAFININQKVRCNCARPTFFIINSKSKL